MMKFFKSVWMRLRKSNNLPGNQILVPMTPPAIEEKPVKIRKPSVKKETTNVTNK